MMDCAHDLDCVSILDVALQLKSNSRKRGILATCIILNRMQLICGVKILSKKKEMSNSKNHQSMINLFFLLAISHSQVSAISFGMIANQIVAAMTCSTEAKSSQCCTVAKIWTMMKKNMTRATTATSCCQYLGQKVQRSGIPGVYCDSDGKVIQLFWQSQFLNGSIPPVIEKLEDLQLL
jgi:hypothetical protein